MPKHPKANHHNYLPPFLPLPLLILLFFLLSGIISPMTTIKAFGQTTSKSNIQNAYSQSHIDGIRGIEETYRENEERDNLNKEEINKEIKGKDIDIKGVNEEIGVIGFEPQSQNPQRDPIVTPTSESTITPTIITNNTNTDKFMLGAIVGDIIGSTREMRNVKKTDFMLFPKGSHPTDDTVMSLAVAKWLTEDESHSRKELVKYMQQIGLEYPHAGYGGRFSRWLTEKNPQPYNSWGNGSAMRVSPVALYASTLEEALKLAEITADVTHNHPEGIKGAQAIAAAVFLKRQGKSKQEIKEYIEKTFHYDLDRKIDDIRKVYKFDVSCQGSVPEAIIAYLESNDFEDAIRKAISIGGDSDTIAAMAGSIAAIEYGIPNDLVQECLNLMTDDQKEILEKFEKMISERNAQGK